MSTELTIIAKPIGESKFGVDARTLHSRLESKQDFSNWMKYKIGQLHLQENIDFLVDSRSTNFSNGENAEVSGFRQRIEYVFTAETALRVLAAEGTDTGRALQAELAARVVKLTESPKPAIPKGSTTAREARLRQQACTAQERVAVDRMKAELAVTKFKVAAVQKLLTARYLSEVDKRAIAAAVMTMIGMPDVLPTDQPRIFPPRMLPRTDDGSLTPPSFDDIPSATPSTSVIDASVVADTAPTTVSATTEPAGVRRRVKPPKGWKDLTHIARGLHVHVSKLVHIVTTLGLRGSDGNGIPGLSIVTDTLTAVQYIGMKETTKYYYSPEAVKMIRDKFHELEANKRKAEEEKRLRHEAKAAVASA